MKPKLDYTKLEGEDLFTYFEQDHPDREYARTLLLLKTAVSDFDEAVAILKRAIKEGRKFVAIYP